MVACPDWRTHVGGRSSTSCLSMRALRQPVRDTWLGLYGQQIQRMSWANPGVVGRKYGISATARMSIRRALHKLQVRFLRASSNGTKD